MFFSPQVPSRTGKGDEGIVLDGSICCLRTPVFVPRKQNTIGMRQIISSRCTLGAPAIRVLAIPFAKEPAAALCRFVKHAVSARIGGTIGDAVLHYMNVNTRPERAVQIFAVSTRNNFLNREIRQVGVFTMKESGSDPNFISDFQFRAESNCHLNLPWV